MHDCGSGAISNFAVMNLRGLLLYALVGCTFCVVVASIWGVRARFF